MGERYAEAGVNYKDLKILKDMMRAYIPLTREFPHRHGAEVSRTGVVRYTGPGLWGTRTILESLGTKIWTGMCMKKKTGNPKHLSGIGQDLVEMGNIDLLRQGAMPVALADLIAVRDGSWCRNEEEAGAIAEGIYRGCAINGMAFTGGETPALPTLLKALDPVDEAPVMACAATGIIAPLEREIVSRIHRNAQIVGVASSGPHANGYSLLNKLGLGLKEQFLHVLPETGKTFGEEILVPTLSYLRLMEALFVAKVPLLAVVPGTGGGLGKLAADRRSFTYHIESWPEDIPPIFPFLLKLDVPLTECLSVFNWGVGLYLIVDEARIDRTIEVGQAAGYKLYHLGYVDGGLPEVFFKPAGLTIYPPGD